MALMFSDSECPNCGQLVHNGTGYFGTSGGFFSADHPLYRFCDTGIHWDCYEHWPSRAEFAYGYFEVWREAEKTNPYWGMAYLSDSVVVTVCPSIRKISVRPIETGIDVQIPLSEWAEWITDVKHASAGFHRVQQRAIHNVFAELQSALPDVETMLVLVDWQAKRDLLQAEVQQNRLREENRLHTIQLHNAAWRQMLQSDPDCPYCGNKHEIRVFDKSPLEKSYFICNACARSFRPEVDAEAVAGIRRGRADAEAAREITLEEYRLQLAQQNTSHTA